jgi:hypothetical protein
MAKRSEAFQKWFVDSGFASGGERKEVRNTENAELKETAIKREAFIDDLLEGRTAELRRAIELTGQFYTGDSAPIDQKVFDLVLEIIEKEREE